MSGIKRKIVDGDPDYEDISHVREDKRSKIVEQNAREETVIKIQTIIKEQFSVEIKNKEHEIDVIDQRLSEARRMMDKLRACIVTNYYCNTGQAKGQETQRNSASALNHPAIRRFLEPPSRSSSPLNQGSEVASTGPSDSEALTEPSCCYSDSKKALGEGGGGAERRAGRNTGKDTFGVPSSSLVSATADPLVTHLSTGDDSSRFFLKKTIVVGNVSKYIAPDKRDENDQSTHKWMVYVRGGRDEPGVDNFVRKVWFFLHPSYRPNDLVEVSAPPFHLTRRGWGEFPVRIQIHFRDSRNKRIDIIHNLKLDRTYTGLQTLGAETVVDVELHRPATADIPLLPPPSVHCPSPLPQILADQEKATATATRTTHDITVCPQSTSAFQPITDSCKIVQQSSQGPSPSVSPGKAFQPLATSCKIVSGSAVVKQTAHAHKLSTSKAHVGTLLSSGVKMIIQQETGEVSAQPQLPAQQVMVPATHQHQPAAAQQFVAVKGGHMITMSAAQKQGGGVMVSGAMPTLQSAVKQAAIGSGQIIVAKSSPAISKVMTQKQVMAQGVAKAIVSGSGAGSGTSGIGGQQAHAVTKAVGGSSSGGKGGVMATLQLPANNLANLANLPPGTKLYLTTNSKNPSGKGKLLLIPQGAILRATGSGQQTQSAASSATGSSQSSSGSSSSGSSLPSNLSCTSYILKQTPQGTFLVGQPSGSGKLSAPSSSSGPSASGAGGHQQIRVTPSQKAAILAQVVGGSQSSQVKLSDGSVKTISSATEAHLSKPGTTTLRMAGGVITTTSSPTSAPSTPMPHAAEGVRVSPFPAPMPSSSPKPQQHQILMAANQAAIISAAKNASNAAAAMAAAASVSAKGSTGTVVTVGKGVPASVPVIGLGKGLSGQAGSTLSTGVVSGQAVYVPRGEAVLSTLSARKGVASPGSAAATQNAPTATSTPKLPLVKTEPVVYSCSGPGRRTPTPGPAPTPPTTSIKIEQRSDSPFELNIEYIENMTQLLTAAVKKVPLIVPEKNEDSNPFCATSVDQYYGWNIGKRRAAEMQRAVAVRRTTQEAMKRIPALQALTPPKTRQVMQWCRHHGYTPPEPRRTEESIEDILTQIDNEPECPSTLHDCEELCQRVERLQTLLKTEVEEDEEPLDVVTVAAPPREPLAAGSDVKPKTETQESGQEPSFHLGADSLQQFIRDAAEQVGVTFQPVEVEKNVFAPLLEALILKATEQFASDVLRGALANAYGGRQNRPLHEVSVMNVHQSVCSIPSCDFLTNQHMGFEIKETE